jgi:hypothetical protein
MTVFQGFGDPTKTGFQRVIKSISPRLFWAGGVFVLSAALNVVLQR